MAQRSNYAVTTKVIPFGLGGPVGRTVQEVCTAQAAGSKAHFTATLFHFALSAEFQKQKRKHQHPNS